MLGLQARVIGNSGFSSRSAPAGDDFRERFVEGQTPQATRLPLPEVLGHGLFAERLAEEHPRFVSAFGCDANLREFLLGVLGPVAATKAEV